MCVVSIAILAQTATTSRVVSSPGFNIRIRCRTAERGAITCVFFYSGKHYHISRIATCLQRSVCTLRQYPLVFLSRHFIMAFSDGTIRNDHPFSGRCQYHHQCDKLPSHKFNDNCDEDVTVVHGLEGVGESNIVSQRDTFRMSSVLCNTTCKPLLQRTTRVDACLWRMSFKLYTYCKYNVVTRLKCDEVNPLTPNFLF